VRVDALPVNDGRANDRVWAATQGLITRDRLADVEIRLKAVYDDQHIAWLVQYADETEDREHKTMLWDSALEMYKTGPAREDTFVFKWNMEPLPVDLTLAADAPYRADIWYWKSHRTDHAGFADDKHQLYVSDPLPNAKRLISNSGNLFYLKRSGDSGRSAYQAEVHPDYQSEQASRFKLRTPEGSRADIRAKGVWLNGHWTIEFLRRLDTGQPDDLALNPQASYRFGVSRYEIAGRSADHRIDQPLFGSGDISEHLKLIFD
nr:ethylbenzene dehydrogenase-related protein [Gammaproteobacteria bacterium]